LAIWLQRLQICDWRYWIGDLAAARDG